MPNEHRLERLNGRFMHRNTRSARPSSAGFSLVELMVVMAIALVVSAFAIPTLTTTMDGIRLRAALGSASNIAQRCRMQAVKRNSPQRLHFSTVGASVALYVTDSDPQLWAQYWLSSQFSIPGAPAGAGAPPVLTNTQMWGTSTVNVNVNTDPYFNSRGIPCQPVVGAGCTNNGGFVYYYRYRNAGHTRWAATSISPAGRIEGWIWNGTSWDN